MDMPPTRSTGSVISTPPFTPPPAPPLRVQAAPAPPPPATRAPAPVEPANGTPPTGLSSDFGTVRPQPPARPAPGRVEPRRVRGSRLARCHRRLHGQLPGRPAAACRRPQSRTPRRIRSARCRGSECSGICTTTTSSLLCRTATLAAAAPVRASTRTLAHSSTVGPGASDRHELPPVRRRAHPGLIMVEGPATVPN